GSVLTADEINSLIDGFSVDSDSWDYSILNSTVQFLAEGETITLSFDVTVDDGNTNGTDTKTVSITITGTNDTPVLTVDMSGAVTEDIDVVDGLISDTGILSFTDVDVNDNNHQISEDYIADSITWSAGDITSVLTNDQINSIIDGFSVTDNSWSFSVDNSLIQFLDAGETITLSFNVTVDDGKGGTDTETVTITINGQEDLIQGEFSKEIWVPAALDQVVDPYIDGYPLNIPIPIDVDATDDLMISALSLEFINANGATELGEIWYLDDDNGPTQYDFDNPVELSATELSTLIYMPADNSDAAGQVDISLTFTITSGNETVDGDFIIHTVPANQLENSVTIGGADSSPLNSGNPQEASFGISDEFANAINLQPENGTLNLFTDFQKSPFAIPIPVDERGNTGAAYEARETEVSVRLIINGIVFIVLLADDPNNIEQTWFYDPDTGLMKASIDYSNIVMESDPLTTLADYIGDNPAVGGDVWTVTYEDNNGGSYQARFVQADFNHELLPDNAVTVVGEDNVDNLIFGTTENDSLTGANLNDEIYGREGNDMIYGLDGDDVLIGGSGNDTIDGGAGNDTIIGGIGDDMLIGGTGSDTLYGGEGSDKLYAGVDNDIDTFIWEVGTADASVDIVYDFTVGEDVLDLSDILTDENNDGATLEAYLNFTFEDYDDGNGADGIIDTVITIDTNGGAPGGEVLTIVLNNVDLSAGGTITDQATIINNLLNENSLITDTIP
ncbi:VCBS domain-containing protein, partial [Shewanella sp. AS1]|uniref:VCBS domain-containing protein n=1 Tax=Shewanella sp. AS1 TaxID=2907626 RepID=UPI001F240656